MNIINFPKNPYPGQVFWDMKSKVVFEYWTPDKELPAGIKPKWITKSFEAECIAMLFSKKAKEKYFDAIEFVFCKQKSAYCPTV